MKSYAVWGKILPGKSPEWQTFTKELSGNRKQEYTAWLKKCGVSRGRFWTQHTSNGDGSFFVWEGKTPDRFYTELARSNDQFAKWYRAEMKEIYGWDFASQKDWNWNWQASNWNARRTTK